jgi:hypothetical protein
VTPFAFLIDEQGIITSKGIAGSKQYLGYVLSGAGNRSAHDEGQLEWHRGNRPGHDETEPAIEKGEKRASKVSIPISTKETVHV